MLERIVTQRVHLKVALHREHLGHCIRDWRARSKHHTATFVSGMAVSISSICGAMKLRRVLSETGIFSKLECVTMTASQFPVAIRLNRRARLLAVKSSFPAARIFAVG